MKTIILSAMFLTTLLPALAAAPAPEDENARLRAEIEQLKTQLQAAQNSCAVGSPVAAAVAGSPLTPASPAATLPPAIAVAKPEAPAGYKLVKIEPALPKDDRWKNPRAWDDLSKGMSKQDVEDLLGIEHTVADGNGRSFWGYGKVGPSPSGRVIFVADRLSVWVRPSF